MHSYVLLALALLSPSLGLAGTAHVEDLPIDVSVAPNSWVPGTPAVLYINGCFGSGCRISAGSDSSVANTSSLIKGSAAVPAYSYGTSHFREVVDCVRELYEPFGITVVDFDPGNTPHFETIVAGMPTNLGFPAEVGGVAPFNCSVVPNAVSFVFPGKLGGDTRRICETIAHESAHAWGLEHTYRCEDTMTYLSGCGEKVFADFEASCGEDSPRPCKCGGDKQNSYRKIMEQFGASNPTPPTIDMHSPRSGERLDQGFAVKADATDNIGVRAVELWIDGELVSVKSVPPYEFQAPELANGPHLVEVKALDDVYTSAIATAQVLVGPACQADGDCAGGQVCAGQVCVSGPNVAGGLGTSCDTNSDCDSRICTDTDTDRQCVLSCGSDPTFCPSGFSCEPMGLGDPVCISQDAGGCQVAGSGTPAAWMLSMLGFFLVLRRRRC